MPPCFQLCQYQEQGKPSLAASCHQYRHNFEKLSSTFLSHSIFERKVGCGRESSMTAHSTLQSGVAGLESCGKLFLPMRRHRQQPCTFASASPTDLSPKGKILGRIVAYITQGIVSYISFLSLAVHNYKEKEGCLCLGHKCLSKKKQILGVRKMKQGEQTSPQRESDQLTWQD